MLDEAAMNAVKHWSFVPARQGDTPIPAWVDVPILFRLK
jgi:protein TonB